MNVLPFSFDGSPVRVLGIGSEPWFVAKDVAQALGYAKTANAVSAHCKKAVSVGSLNQGPLDVGGTEIANPSDLDPQTKIIPEGDVYRLIVRSNLPSAERFEALVMDEILPTIRKTGSYGPAQSIDYTDPNLMLGLIGHLKQEAEAAKATAASLQIENHILSPKAQAFDAYLSSEGVCMISHFCNKYGVKVRHPGYALRARKMLHVKKMLATQIGISSGILKNVVDQENFEYVDSKGNSVEAQSAYIVVANELRLLSMLINGYGATAFRSPQQFDRAKSLVEVAA